MSRIPKWKVEKAKVKVVFRLQFHATHIPQPGWDKLFVSFVPADTGKAIAKTTKANVRNGNCKWSDPIYETTRLLQDPRSRKYDEKLYKLVVTMGSSRSSLLGEATINLADFADALRPSSVALPLYSCDYGTILHVTVQLLTSKTGFREFEQQRELSVKTFQTSPGQRSHDSLEAAAASIEMESERSDKVNISTVRFKEDSPEFPSLEEVGESNKDYEDSVAGIDGSSNTSESLYAEKNGISSVHEVDCLKSITSGDISASLAVQSPRIVKGNMHDIQLSKQGSNDWTHGWSSDYSADQDLVTAYEENSRLRVRLEGVEATFLQLKTETKSLQSLSDELGAETHSLAKQLAMELASGEKLTREVSILKLECYKFKKELEELKSAMTMKQQVPDSLFMDQNSFPNQHQAKWLQALFLLENKIQEIQNKACLGYHGNGLDFLSSDFDVLDCILQNLKFEASLGLGEETQSSEMQSTHVLQPEHFIHGQDLEGSHVDHHHHPEVMFHHVTNSLPLKRSIDSTSILEEKMNELLKKLEESDSEREILTKKMDQMECYYEALIQELEESRHQAVNELENLKTEHSSCLYTVSSLQSQVEKLQRDMGEQFVRFTTDNHDLCSLNKELEKRAVASETALKRVRLNYAIAVDRLQKDLELLSFQVLSMYETNENLAKQALTDVSQLFPHQFPEKNPDEQYMTAIANLHSESTMVNGISHQLCLGTASKFDFHKENKNILQRGLLNNADVWTLDKGKICGDGLKINNVETYPQLILEEKDLVYRTQQGNKHWEGSPVHEPKHESPNHNVESNYRMLADNIGHEETKRSLHMLQKLQVDTEAELSEMHMLNLHWEVFTQILKEAVHSVNDGVLHMKNQMAQLAQQLEHSTSEKELLMHKLHGAIDDVRKLRKEEANCRSMCDDLVLKNHVLEAKIEDILGENDSLARKVAEYELKYKSCLEERNEFEAMLMNESLQRSCLQSEIRCLQSEIRSTIENHKALKEEFDNQSSANSELQRTLSYLQKKLGGLCQDLVPFSEKTDRFTVDSHSLKQEMESNNYMGIVQHLEKLQQEACKKILQLYLEIKEIETDRNLARHSLNKTESQLDQLKQQLESDIEETRLKLDLSNVVAEKLRLELEDVAAELKSTLEAEEKLKSTNRELSSKLTIMEIEIQQANDANRDIAQKIVELDNVKAELECTKLNLMSCMQENNALMMSVESGKVVSVHLENELRNLKEDLRNERGSREELKATITNLTLQLKEKDQQLISCDEQISQLTFLRRRVNDLETEMQHFLFNSKECQKNLEDEISTLRFQIADLEFYLAEIIDHSLKADVKVTYQRCQFQVMVEELIDENKAVRGKFEELHLKHADDVSSLKDDVAAEAQITVETRMKLGMSDALVEKLKAELQDVADTLRLSLEAEEKHKNTNIELSSKISFLECEIKQAHDENRVMAERILEFNNVKGELERTNFRLMNCMQENEALKMSIESVKVICIQLENELRILKEILKCAHNNLRAERGSREELEAAVGDLNLQLKVKDKQLLSCDEQKSELLVVRKRVTDLEIELQNLLLSSKECQRKLKDEIPILHHQIAELEYYLAEILDDSISADVNLTCQKCQFQMMIEEIVGQNKAVQGEFEALQLKYTDILASLEDHITVESKLADENERLSTALQSMKDELDGIVHEKEGLLDYINEKSSALAEFDNVKARAATLEADNSIEQCKYEDEICRLRHTLVGLEEEVDGLQSTNVELENTQIILKCKLDEQNTHISLLEECERELKILREQHSELTYKLSEQILKTEEFKNLSIHLRDLKDKADAERLQAREKRESEGSSLALQDSLRIAFIKEQCESKLEDMKKQLFASKKYAEEMLLKLQAALDDVEAGKRSEASLAKLNEELSTKMSDMEAELQTVVTNRRELANACDRMKAELECTVLSLDCCKEEKLKLEASLHECNEDRKRLRVELDLVKRLLENMVSCTADVEVQKSQPYFHSTMSIGEMLKDGNSQSSVDHETPNVEAACSDEMEITKAGEDPVHNVDRGNLPDTSPILSSNRELHHAPPAWGSGSSLPTSQPNSSDLKDARVTVGLINKETSLENSTKHISDIKQHFKEQHKLLTSMNLFHKELERLKNDNLSSVIPLEDHHLDASLQGLRSDLSQLDEANEHLESIFPVFKELSGSGNALERVLALELELAETLQAKKKDIRFQSSFLKQHNDNEAVFKSFKDINELIKDMLEVKRRNAAVETELKEMQSRYSQLSLRFAEVEGERQQLLMTLKNRSPRKS